MKCQTLQPKSIIDGPKCKEVSPKKPKMATSSALPRFLASPDSTDTCACAECLPRYLHARASGENLPPGKIPPSVDNVLQSKGRPLDASARAVFEPRLGRSLDDVRIHDDERADASARGVRAKAYTVGSDIVFRRGMFAPGTSEGEQLLAHELAHVAERAPSQAQATSQRMIQRQPEEEEKDETAGRMSEEAGRHAMETITLTTTQQNAEWLGQREFSPNDPRVEQAAPAETKAARAAFEGLAPAQERALSAIPPARAEMEQEQLRIADKPEKDREASEIQFLDHVPGARSALEEFTALEPMDILLKEEGIQMSEDRVKRAADALSALSKLSSVSGAKRAISAYGKALAAYRSSKAALRKALQAKGILGNDGNILPCVKTESTHPKGVSPAHVEKIKKGEGFAPLPYKALEGVCTIGYGHQTGRPLCPGPDEPPSEKPCCSPGGPPVSVGTQTMEGCTCSPPMAWDEAKATRQLESDINTQGKYIKNHVMVDLDQAHFDALVDLSGHVGSLPVEFLETIHRYACTDDAKVRDAYLNTALTIKDHPEKGPVFKPRREERVWPAGKPGEE